MLKQIGLIMFSLLLLGGCSQPLTSGKIEKVGLLVPDTINEPIWGSKGYRGLLKIQSRFNVDVFYKEGINSQEEIESAVKEFANNGVNLIFGHGNEYSVIFNTISEQYPNIHFISFNGSAEQENTTSLNFDGYAMGFFGGIVAAHMSDSNHIATIAAFEWQPEVEGFYEGATFYNNEIVIDIYYVGHWDKEQQAVKIVEELMDEGADVIYPAGDGYNAKVIERVKERGAFVIGYVSDQADFGTSTVLTSTVQHVDQLYELAAEKFNSNKLESGNLSFDFQDDVISLGAFSPLVDDLFKEELLQQINTYRETGKLPNQ